MTRLLPLMLCSLWACEGAEPAQAPLSDVAPPVASVRVAPRDARFSVELPSDLLVQPFTSSILATSADGAFRVFVESRPGRLLEVLGQLKDELIGLGWEVTQEKHFQTATLLTLGQGPSRSRYERSIWLVQAEPDTLICDAQARSHGTSRLGASHRVLCQTLGIGPPPAEGATP